MEDTLRSTVKRSKPNYLYAILGVALVLYLLGCFGLVVLNGQSLVNSYKESLVVMVELEKDLPEFEKTKILQRLKAAAYTKKESIAYISKEEAAKMHEEEFGESFSDLGFANPFYDVVNFSTKAAYLHPDSLQSVKTELSAMSTVRDVFYQEGLVDNLEANVKKASYLALILGILFIFVAVTLIHNTIKLALYSNRFLIKNMELVGASWGFISRPFLLKSLQNGFWSVLLSWMMLTATIFFIRSYMVELDSLLDPTLIIILYTLLFILGMLITTLSTYYVVNKYLRMQLDDLY